MQGGVLEIHTRGATIDDRERADRLVFDLDPGPGTTWDDVVEAARDVRARLSKLKLKSFLKTSGGKGLHVILPIKSTPWNEAKAFAQKIAASMAADLPERYIATATKSGRAKRIFIDYLRNSREATAVAPYSTRARPGAPVSVPIEWSELDNLKTANQYTVLNLVQRLAPTQRSMGRHWAFQTDIAKVDSRIEIVHLAAEGTPMAKTNSSRSSRDRAIGADTAVFPVCAYHIGMDGTSVGVSDALAMMSLSG